MEASGTALRSHVLTEPPNLALTGIRHLTGIGPGLGLTEKSGYWVSCPASTMPFAGLMAVAEPERWGHDG